MQLPTSEPRSAPVTPAQLKHYQLRRQLGEGGYGQVFEAWDEKLQRRVAIKVLKRLPGMSQPACLLKEARLAASLQHAAFVKIFATEEEGDSQAIVMELVPGLTLKQLLQSQPPDQALAHDVLQQVAAAMQEAHACGLIHGDLKPSNLMREPSGKIRILDFGLATQGDAQATTSLNQLDPQGTIAYMAPERLLGAPASAQTDIYALGVILYQLLSGRRPFESLSGLALAAAHMQSSSDSWEFPAGTGPALIQLVLAMTARQPERRLSSMTQVLQQLQADDSGLLPVAAAIVQTPGWRNRLPQLSRRQRRSLSAVAAVVALLAGGWQAAPYVAELSKLTLEPYSESLSIKQGLDALKLFDRPGSLDAATKSFETILKHDPNHAAAAAGLSLVYSYRYASEGQDDLWLQKADASAQQSLQLNQQLALGHVAHAWVLDKQGKGEQALITSEKALSLEPENFFAWLGKMNTLRRLRRHDEAKKIAELGLQRNPSERIFADALGSIQMQLGNYQDAEQAFRLSIKLQPDAVVAYANLYAALMRQDRKDEAMQVLQQGLQIRPSAWLFANLGNALFVRGDYVAAVAAFENAVSPTKGNPNDYLNWANLADTLLWIPGRKDEARKAYGRARQLLEPRLSRTPKDVTLVSRMALYAARVGDKNQAEELIKRSLNLAPTSADVQFRIGLAHELLGNRQLAVEAITKAKEFGYPVRLIESEPDLLALRRDARYQ